MRPFNYVRATDADAAARAVAANPRAKFLAGGTNLLDLMKEDVERPTELVDLTRLRLADIRETPGGLSIGALATNSVTANHPVVRRDYPLLTQAILAGASGQLRNMATNGGNLLQRTRCYYFYDAGTPCNKREPGSGCPAIPGLNRMHAILGTSEYCIATHPSDFCVALAALDAVVQVQGPHGPRSIPFAEFHCLPGDTPHIDNTLRPDEIITAIDLPPRGFADHYAYLKLRDRASFAFALVSVAAALEMDGERISEARLAVGGVAHKPWRVPAAEAELRRSAPTERNFQRTAEAYLEGAESHGQNAFKIELAKRAIVRALVQAVRMEKNVDRLVHRTTTEPR